MYKNLGNFNYFKDFLKNKISWNGYLGVNEISKIIKDKCEKELNLVVKINGSDINKFLKDIGFIEKDKNNNWITTPDGQKFSTNEKWISSLMNSDKFLNALKFLWIKYKIKNGIGVKIYTISTIENKNILNDLKNYNLCSDKSSFIKDNFWFQKNKTKIIDENSYNVFIRKYENSINLEKINTIDEKQNIFLTKADFILTFIDDNIGFFISEVKYDKISHLDDCFILTNDNDIFNYLKSDFKITDDNLFVRNDSYKATFNETKFILLTVRPRLKKKLSLPKNDIANMKFKINNKKIKWLFLKPYKLPYKSMFNLTSTDSNITKILIIQLLYKIYFIQYKIIHTTLKNEFSTLDTEKILNIRKEFLRYKALAGEIQSGREEAQKIYDLIEKRLLIKQKMDLAYKNLNEYFAIVNEETKIKEEAEKEKRDKFNSRITRIAATITILTFISVIADICNLFDRFFK